MKCLGKKGPFGNIEVCPGKVKDKGEKTSKITAEVKKLRVLKKRDREDKRKNELTHDWGRSRGVFRDWFSVK